MADLDRENVRQLVESANLANPNEDQIVLLHGCVARRLIEFDGIRGSYRVADIKGRSIRVRAYYFDDREGVTFNEDGFVGFAGWADNTNIQPILKAVVDWVEEVTGKSDTNIEEAA